LGQHHARNNHEPQAVFAFGDKLEQSDLALRFGSGSGFEERRIFIDGLGGGGSGFKERVVFTDVLGIISSLGMS